MAGRSRLKFNSRSFNEIFGLYGEERNAEAWLKWLKRLGDDGQNAVDAIEQLVAEGCDQSVLVDLLMELQRSTLLKPLSRRQLKRIIDTLNRAQRAIGQLVNSTLVYEVGLAQPSRDSSQRGWVLDAELMGLAWRCSDVKSIATRKENIALVTIATRLARYAREATGVFQDEALDQVINAFLDRPFEMETWRKRHKVRRKGAKNRPERP